MRTQSYPDISPPSVRLRLRAFSASSLAASTLASQPTTSGRKALHGTSVAKPLGVIPPPSLRRSRPSINRPASAIAFTTGAATAKGHMTSRLAVLIALDRNSVGRNDRSSSGTSPSLLAGSRRRRSAWSPNNLGPSLTFRGVACAHGLYQIVSRPDEAHKEGHDHQAGSQH